ncbi:MAG: tripartite tricarboxylate transporter TctB family protein [Noviherbaspirillum sp.]
MHIRNQKDFWAGLMFVAFGLFFSGFGTRYTFGSAARMGPGYFPTVLGIILVLLGAAIAMGGVSAKAEEHKVGKFSWPTIVLVLGAVVLFGVLLNTAGLIIALVAVVMVSSYASHEFGWKAALINTVALVALCLFLFVYALSLQFPLWPTIFAG